MGSFSLCTLYLGQAHNPSISMFIKMNSVVGCNLSRAILTVRRNCEPAKRRKKKWNFHKFSPERWMNRKAAYRGSLLGLLSKAVGEAGHPGPLAAQTLHLPSCSCSCPRGDPSSLDEEWKLCGRNQLCHWTLLEFRLPLWRGQLRTRGNLSPGFPALTLTLSSFSGLLTMPYSQDR